jgi:hypothetical protein
MPCAAIKCERHLVDSTIGLDPAGYAQRHSNNALSIATLCVCRAGLDSVFIMSGVHSDLLNIAQGSDEQPSDPALLQTLYEARLPQGHCPTHAVTSLKW